MTTNLMELAKKSAEIAKEAGASDARSFVSRGRQVMVEWRDGKLDRIRESTSQGLSITLYVDGKYSSNSTSDIRPDAVEAYVKEAVATTRYLAADEHRKLPDPARYEGRTSIDLERTDPDLGSVSPEARLSMAKQLEDAARAGEGADRIVSVTSSVGDYEGRTVGYATNGFEAEEDGTYTSRSVSVSISDEDDRKPRAYGYGSARYAADLPGPEQLGAEALTRALAQTGSKQVPTGVYEMIVENRTVGTLSSHLMRPLHGGSIQQKRSCFEDKLDQQVGSELLTIMDDPHRVRGLSSTSWDGEGMATKPRALFDKGVLKLFYLDTYYASKLGMEPTTGGSSNLLWTPGDKDLEGMIADMGEGLLITSFLGGNSNSTTGDFSLGIKGFYIKDGQRVHPVSEVNIAGNHLEFWKQLSAVGSDPWIYSSNRTPSLRFSGVQCSGSEA